MRSVIAIAGGWLVWAAFFSTVYALHGLGCDIGMNERVIGPASVSQILMGSVWIVAMAATLIGLTWLRRRPDCLEGDVPRRVATAGWIGGFCAIVLTGLPILFPASCL